MTESFDKDGTKDRIYLAGRAHLEAVGPTLFETKEVARLAGVTQSQINYHFGGRDALLVELCSAMLVAHIDESIDRVESQSDPVKGVLAFVECAIEFAETHGSTAVLISSPELFVSSDVPKWQLDGAALSVLDASERSSTVLFSACWAVAKGREYRRLNRARLALAAVANPKVTDAVVVIGMATGGFARVMTQHRAKPIFGFSPGRLLRNACLQVLRGLSTDAPTDLDDDEALFD